MDNIYDNAIAQADARNSEVLVVDEFHKPADDTLTFLRDLIFAAELDALGLDGRKVINAG